MTVDRGGGEAPCTACLRRTRSIRRGGHSAHTSIIKGLVTIDRGGREAPRTACLRRTRSIRRGGHSAHTSIIKGLVTVDRAGGEAPRTACLRSGCGLGTHLNYFYFNVPEPKKIQIVGPGR